MPRGHPKTKHPCQIVQGDYFGRALWAQERLSNGEIQYFCRPCERWKFPDELCENGHFVGVWFCHNCGDTGYDDRKQFCHRCGHPLDWREPPTEQA